MDTATGNRVVITGTGVICPLGVEAAPVWQALIEGRSGIGPITWFDVSEYSTRFAACVRDFDPGRYMAFKKPSAWSIFPSSRFCFEVGDRIRRPGPVQEDPTRIGVEIGTAIGGMGLIEEQRDVLRTKGPRRVNPICVPMVIANMSACMVGIHFGLKGPNSSPVAACATGAVAIGEAMWRLRLGQADVMLAGGTESADTPLGVAAFSRLGALSARNEEPERRAARSIWTGMERSWARARSFS